MDPDARRGRVVRVALDRLRRDGYASLTLESIARAAEVDEAEVRAIFGDVEGLIGELVGPLARRLRAVVALAAEADLRQPHRLRVVLDEYHDALASHRELVGILVWDPAASSSSAAVGVVRAAMCGVRDELARGTGADLEQRIRAASALGAVQAAVLELVDMDQSTVRDVTVGAAVAILLSSRSG